MTANRCPAPHPPDLRDPAEREAYHLVPMFLAGGVTAEQYDCCGRQGTVDFLLDYPDGREAALEVTTEAGPGARQLYSLLDEKTLPNPGKWTWSATIDDPRDLPQLEAWCGRIILTCEAAGIREPKYAYNLWQTDPDINWLIRSSVNMYGSPNLPRADGDRERPLFVMPGPSSGGVDETLSQFPQAFREILDSDNVQRHVAKLLKSGQDERHLFLLCDTTALPFSVSYALALRDAMPPAAPILPQGVTHLWLMVRFSRWVFLVTEQDMTRFKRPDDDLSEPA